MIDDLLPQLDQIPPLDLDSSTLETLYYLCLAQAQECFWIKAKSESLKDSLIARLATQVSDYYSQTLDHANRCSSIRSEWMHHFTCKKYHFHAAAQYRASLDSLNKGRYGEEIGRLKDALESCSIALTNSQYVSSSVLEDLQELNSRVKSDLVGAEKDNDMIYLQTVPTASSLSPITPIVMAKHIIPEEMVNPLGYLETTRHVQPLFADILPYTIYEANNAYHEKMNEYVHKNLISKIEEMTVNMHSALQELNLPGSLEAVEKPMGVPQSLIVHSDDIRTKGGVSLLRGTLNDIQKLFRESEHALDGNKEMLMYEEKEDTMMRDRQGTDRWNRAPSREAGDDLWKAVTNFRGYLESSKASDQLVRDKFHKIERYLEILCEGPKQLERYIPNSTVVHVDPYLEYNVQELKEALLRIRGIEDQRQQYIGNLMYTVANTEMLPDIIKEYNLMIQQSGAHSHVDVAKFETVYTKKISKLQTESSDWIKKQEENQATILAQIVELNKQFLEIRDNDSSTIERENAIQNLEVAYYKFGEIMQNLDEGRKFYNSLIEQLRSFTDQCKEFVYQRRIEGRQLENSISEAFSQLSMEQSTEMGNERQIHASRHLQNEDSYDEDDIIETNAQEHAISKSARSFQSPVHNASPPQTPLAAPQARHPAMISRVWQATDDIKFSPSAKPSSSRSSPSKTMRTWQPGDGINFSPAKK